MQSHSKHIDEAGDDEAGEPTITHIFEDYRKQNMGWNREFADEASIKCVPHSHVFYMSPTKRDPQVFRHH